MAASQSDKTEEPTPKRLREARQRGQVPRSRELSAALAALAAFAVLVGAGAGGLVCGVALVRDGIEISFATNPASLDAFATESTRMLAYGLWTFAKLLAPLLAGICVVAFLGGALQSGLVFSPEKLKPDVSRLAPRFSNVVSAETAFQLAKGAVILLVLVAVVLLPLRSLWVSLARLTGRSALVTVHAAGMILSKLGLILLVTTLVIGVADYLWQRRRVWQQLRMSREEVKREFKESEGDPQHKAERRRLHREMGRQTMLQDVRKADFVVVNPTHLAIAVRYDADSGKAPVVVASGENLIAEQIKEIAREAGVPVFRDVTLARSLVEIDAGDEIPESLFEAVAALLKVVYSMGAT